MPDAAVHASFGKEVLASLEEPVRSVMQAAPYQMALFGPDPWFVYLPDKSRGGRMHTDRPGAFLCSLARHARDGRSREAMFSYLAGFLCHYALDSAAHPYIVSHTAGPSALPGAHRAFEHTMDILEMRRLGLWEGRHPLTASFAMPALRLPPEMRSDLSAAYREVYGWEKSFRSLRWLYPFFRWVYRLMENPKGIAARMARLTGKPQLRSLAYSESWYEGQDVENNTNRPWPHSHDETLVSRESLTNLRAAALERTLAMIRACYRYVFIGDLSDEELAAALENTSYYSGLPASDPRNWNVPSMLPLSDSTQEESSCQPNASNAENP